MRNLIGLIVGMYLTAALVVFGGAAYGFISGESLKYASCTTTEGVSARGPNWAPWALYRAALWPKTYFDDSDKTANFTDWLLVRYNPLSDTCR